MSETAPLLSHWDERETTDDHRNRKCNYLMFFVLGMGPAYNLPNAIALELPWFEKTQPEEKDLAAWMGLATTIASGAGLVFGVYGRLNVGGCTIAFLIILNLSLVVLLAFTWWKTIGGFSIFIWVGTLVGGTIGNLYFLILVPWIAAMFPQTFTSAFISGNSFTAFLSVVLQLVQSPGEHHRFSPTVYLMALALPVVFSFFSLLYLQISGKL